MKDSHIALIGGAISWVVLVGGAVGVPVAVIGALPAASAGMISFTHTWT